MLLIARSKTDQQGAGQRVAVHANPAEPAFCPAAALDLWLRHRLEATDLDWTVSPSTRAARPLFCAVTKSGRLTGAKLSDTRSRSRERAGPSPWWKRICGRSNPAKAKGVLPIC
jgi:hypothetical protein